MFKKTIALLLAITVFASMGISAFAFSTDDVTNTANVTVVNCSQSITAQQITEIKEAVDSYVILNDGTKVPAESVVTIEDVSTDEYSCYSLSPNNTYKVSVQARASTDKIVSDNDYKNKGETNASITLEMVWTDVTGPNNVLKEVSGTLSVIKGTVVSGEVKWGDSIMGGNWAKRDVGSSSSFSYTPDFSTYCPSASYTVQFTDCNLYAKVSASIFQ